MSVHHRISSSVTWAGCLLLPVDSSRLRGSGPRPPAVTGFLPSGHQEALPCPGDGRQPLAVLVPESLCSYFCFLRLSGSVHVIPLLPLKQVQPHETAELKVTLSQ